MSHLTAPALSTNGQGRLPDFVILGSQKGGTTALHRYLELHPQVFMSTWKELDFFLDPSQIDPSPQGVTRGAWPLGVDWYRRWFQSDRLACGEASPNYSILSRCPSVAERMQSVIPQAKLVYLVRHPLERARSHYQMILKRPGANVVSFGDFLSRSTAMERGAYGSVLQVFLRHFPREQILVWESAELDNHRRESLSLIFRFLGVDDQFWSEAYSKRLFVGGRIPHVSPLGARVRDSRLMNLMRRRMAPSVFYHVERLLLLPFRIPPPSLALPRDQAVGVVARMRAEVDLLRDLTGQAFPSLEVNLEQSLDPDRTGAK